MNTRATLAAELTVREAEYPPPLVAWFTVAALFFAYIISFVDRMIIGLLVEPMKQDLGLSDTEISLLQGFAFAVFYTFAGIPIARLIDRSSRPRIIAAGIALWSLMTMVCGLCTQYWQLFLARIGVAVGEATLTPAAYAIISDSFPPRRLGMAMGVYSVGSVLGAGLAFLFGAFVISLVAQGGNITVPIIGPVRIWQAAFLFVGLPGLLLVPLFLVLKDPRRSASEATAHDVATMSDVLAYCRSKRMLLIGTFFGVGCINICVFATVSWLPAFYARAHGLTLADAGYTAAAALIIGGLIGYLGGGRFCDIIGGAPNQRLYFAAVVAGTGVLTGAIFPLVGDDRIATALYTLCFTAMAAPTGAAVSALQQVTPSNMRATLSAAYVFVVNIVGMTIGPTLTAVISDVYFPQHDGIRYAMSMVASIGFVAASVLFWLAARVASKSGAGSGAAM